MMRIFLCLMLFVSTSLAFALTANDQLPNQSLGNLGDKCKPIRYPNNSQNGHVNYVFVPFGYGGDMDLFLKDSQRFLVEGLLAEEPFAKYSKVNAFAVTEENDGMLGCGYSGRLIMCSASSAIEIALSNCSAVPENDTNLFKVLVIINNEQYGGGGGEIATAYNGDRGPRVAIHEIGHSYANLSDEYLGGSYLGHNCAFETSCKPWADMIKVGIEDVGCLSGCYSGGAYRPAETLMKDLSYPFKRVSERLLCCALGRDTSGMPERCAFFNQGGLTPLKDFCSLPQDIASNIKDNPGPPSLPTSPASNDYIRNYVDEMLYPGLTLWIGVNPENIYRIIRTQRIPGWGDLPHSISEDDGRITFEVVGTDESKFILKRRAYEWHHGYEEVNGEIQPGKLQRVTRNLFVITVPSGVLERGSVKEINIIERGKKKQKIIVK